MYFLKYKVLPALNGPHNGKYGETLALCWIAQPTQDNAEQRACKSVQEAGWSILSLEEAYPVALEDIDPQHPSHNFFLRARESGEYIFFVTGPMKKPN